MDDSISKEILTHCYDTAIMYSKNENDLGFARRLGQLKKPVHLDVMNHLPHGFLNFSLISAEAAEATALCGKRILEILEVAQPKADG